MLIHKLLVTGPAQLHSRALGRIGEPRTVNASDTYSTARMGAEESIHTMSNRMGGRKLKLVNVLSYAGFSLSRVLVGD